jgi:hypothetical protein
MKLITKYDRSVELTCSERYSPIQQISRGQAIVDEQLVKNLNLPSLRP